MNRWTDRKITLDMICLDNLCNINIYALIRKLSSQNISAFIPVCLKTLDNTGKIFQGYLVTIFCRSYTPMLPSLILTFNPSTQEINRLYELRSHDWLNQHPWQEDLELWLCMDPFFSYVISKFSTCIVLPDWLLLPNKEQGIHLCDLENLRPIQGIACGSGCSCN